MNRRSFLFSNVALAAGLLPGCYTAILFENNIYSEEVSSILITKDKKKLVVITNKFHYIFDAPDTLVKTLESSYQQWIEGKMSGFIVSQSGVTTGQVTLSLVNRDATMKGRDQAILDGYSLEKNSSQLVYTVKITGQRLESGGLVPESEQQKLHRTYHVHIEEEAAFAVQAAKIAVSPVTIAVDGLLIIGVSVLILILVFFCMVPGAGCSAISWRKEKKSYFELT